MDVLLIEDDRRIAALVDRGLRQDGHRVSIAHCGNEGADKMLAHSYDVALLDILLPGMTGLSVLEKVRSHHCTTPILRAPVRTLFNARQALCRGSSLE